MGLIAQKQGTKDFITFVKSIHRLKFYKILKFFSHDHLSKSILFLGESIHVYYLTSSDSI